MATRGVSKCFDFPHYLQEVTSGHPVFHSNSERHLDESVHVGQATVVSAVHALHGFVKAGVRSAIPHMLRIRWD